MLTRRCKRCTLGNEGEPSLIIDSLFADLDHRVLRCAHSDGEHADKKRWEACFRQLEADSVRVDAPAPRFISDGSHFFEQTAKAETVCAGLSAQLAAIRLHRQPPRTSPNPLADDCR